jgi:hypothetical protein
MLAERQAHGFVAWQLEAATSKTGFDEVKIAAEKHCNP